MYTVEVNIYQFNELAAEAKAKAIKLHRCLVEEDFSFETQCITEDFKQQLQEYDYPTSDISWSLSYCKGRRCCLLWSHRQREH